MVDDRLNGFALGGNGCPTDTAVRGSGLTGVVGVLEERKLCEWEWEWDDLGDGLVAVLVTMMGNRAGPASVPIDETGSVHTSGFKSPPQDPSWEARGGRATGLGRGGGGVGGEAGSITTRTGGFAEVKDVAVDVVERGEVGVSREMVVGVVVVVEGREE